MSIWSSFPRCGRNSYQLQRSSLFFHCFLLTTCDTGAELQDAPRAHSVPAPEDQRLLTREASGFGAEVAPICSNRAGNLAGGSGLGLVTIWIEIR